MISTSYGAYFRSVRDSGASAMNGHNSRTFRSGCAKESLSPTCAADYSYLSATMGSTRMARRAGM